MQVTRKLIQDTGQFMYSSPILTTNRLEDLIIEVINQDTIEWLDDFSEVEIIQMIKTHSRGRGLTCTNCEYIDFLMKSPYKDMDLCMELAQVAWKNNHTELAKWYFDMVRQGRKIQPHESIQWFDNALLSPLWRKTDPLTREQGESLTYMLSKGAFLKRIQSSSDVASRVPLECEEILLNLSKYHICILSLPSEAEQQCLQLNEFRVFNEIHHLEIVRWWFDFVLSPFLYSFFN